MIIDLVIIVLLCLYSAIGFKKGMLISLFSIVSFILSIYITYLLLPAFINLLSNALPVKDIAGDIAQSNQILNTFLNSDSKLCVFIRFLLHIDGTTITNTIAEFIISVVAFVVLSFIIKIIIKNILKFIANQLKRFFIIGTFDRLCGVCFGFLKGVLFVCILCFIITSLIEFEPVNAILSTQVDTSSLLSVFNNGTDYIVETVSNLFH